MDHDFCLAIKLARLLFREELSSDTKPTEKQAREAAYLVLLMIQHEFFGADNNDPTAQDIKIFLLDLAYAICPDAMPKLAKRHHIRAIHFKDTTKGARAARAALDNDLDIAIEVHLLNKVGQLGNKLVAERCGVETSEISRICAKPDMKWMVTTAFGKVTAAEAVKYLNRKYLKRG